MLDHAPLHPIPGAARPTDSDDPNAFVAKLRYQQTKVDSVEPTILVEQAVVNVITEQQAWLQQSSRRSPRNTFSSVPKPTSAGSGPARTPPTTRR